MNTNRLVSSCLIATAWAAPSCAASDITDCTLTTNGGYGVWVIGSGHTVHRNTCRGNGVAPMPVPGNIVGPLIDELTVGGNPNPAANYVD